MGFLKIFLSGISQIFSFGLPKGDKIPLISKNKACSGDWQNVARDISRAINKFESKEGKNGKA